MTLRLEGKVFKAHDGFRWKIGVTMNDTDKRIEMESDRAFQDEPTAADDLKGVFGPIARSLFEKTDS